MLSWVVKVVPQPPEPPPKKDEEQKEQKAAVAPPTAAAPPPAPEKKVTFQDERKNETPKADKPQQQEEAAEGNSPAPGPQPGVLMWISGALPQPALSPKLSRANSTTKEENATTSKPEDKAGMISWIAQGLEKVVPQPDLKSPAADQPTEVRQTAAAPAAKPQGTVTEVESGQEDKTDNKPAPRMIDWIKQGIEKVVPQPEVHVRSKTEVNEKTEAPASTKAEAPAPEPPPSPKQPAADTEKSSKEAEQQPNMMGWIVSGIGRMVPQPVQKQDAGSDEVQNISIGQKNTDLILEDMEQDENKEAKQVEKETEDAETQMDQLMDSTKTEAGESVLAHMEERLQQERLEAARIAEEVARKAAEEAVRQLEVEHSAIIVIETLPESNEQLPNILEEENEDDPECLIDVRPAEDDDTPSSTDVEPASERRDLESPISQPITQQPEPQAPEALTTTTDQPNAGAAEEGGSGVPYICSPVKSFLLRFPHAAECLESFRKLTHDHYLTPAKLSMPTPPPELAQLTQELSQLPKQAQQCCMSIASRFRHCFRRLNSNSQHPQQP